MCSHVSMMLLAMPCLDLCVSVFISMIYGQILVFTCLYAWIYVLPCLCAKFLHVYKYVSMPICLDLCFHMPMCLDLCSLHGLYDLPCVLALQAMFVCLDLGYVCHTMLQHNKAMDTQSKPTFVPRGHHLCLFAILPCFPFYSHPIFYICHVYHVYLLYASYCALRVFSFQGLSTGFLSLPLHGSTWNKDAWSQGTVSRAQAKGATM